MTLGPSTTDATFVFSFIFMDFRKDDLSICQSVCNYMNFHDSHSQGSLFTYSRNAVLVHPFCSYSEIPFFLKPPIARFQVTFSDSCSLFLCLSAHIPGNALPPYPGKLPEAQKKYCQCRVDLCICPQQRGLIKDKYLTYTGNISQRFTHSLGTLFFAAGCLFKTILGYILKLLSLQMESESDCYYCHLFSVGHLGTL